MRTAVANHLRRLAAIGAALVLLGCGPAPTASSLSPAPTFAAAASPSPGPSVDAASVYAAIAAQIEQIRGLQPTADIAPVLLDADQFRANLTADFDRNNAPAVVRFTQELYIELGLLPPGSSLRDAYLDLQAGQVAGYYSADRKQLFVVSRSGGVGPTQRVTYAHEFTHQLQDQHFDLTKLLGTATDQGDRTLARVGLLEGDAVTAQMTWMTANLTAADLAQLLADASDPAALVALQRAPAILRTMALYPYSEGLAFVDALMAKDGYASVNAAFADPPASTTQILHPELYMAGVQPVEVPLPAGLAGSLGAGWSRLGEDTVGELQVRAWLAANGVDAATAATAASGWAGDRVAIFEGPAGQVALAMIIRWTRTTDVAEFAGAWDVVRSRVAGNWIYDGVLGDNQVGILIGPTQALAERLDAALRP
ncbi:MAG: hypothetical protein HY263_08400 [Chloroflexi bacterium]|nr:hypothetical protein [Chloroflexota bacterium]